MGGAVSSVGGLAARTIGARAAGVQASRTKALVVAGAVGVATGVAVYKLLRSGKSSTEEDAGD